MHLFQREDMIRNNLSSIFLLIKVFKKHFIYEKYYSLIGIFLFLNFINNPNNCLFDFHLYLACTKQKSSQEKRREEGKFNYDTYIMCARAGKQIN